MTLLCQCHVSLTGLFLKSHLYEHLHAELAKRQEDASAQVQSMLPEMLI